MRRFVGIVSVLALGALVGCSDSEGLAPPGVEPDTGTEDTGSGKDSTAPDTTVEDTGAEDTGAEDTGAEDTGADTTVADSGLDTAVIDTSVLDASDTSVLDTSVLDAADTATADTADTAMADTADSATSDAVSDGDTGTVTLPSGEIWVTRVGAGVTTLGSGTTESFPVFIDKFQLSTLTKTGTINMPTAVSGANQPLTFAANATSEGALALSGNGKYVTLAGYATPPGTAAVKGTSTTGSGAVLRVIGRVDAAGTIDTSTTTTSVSGNNIRSAVTNDGTQFWIGGAVDGVSYIPTLGASGAATFISTGATNNRFVVIADDGSLWGSSGSGSLKLYNFAPTALPTTATAPVVPMGLPGSTGSPYGIAAIATGTTSAVDTVYVCDDTSSGTPGGLWRFKAVAGVYGTGVQLSTIACRGLAVKKSGASVLIIDVTAESTSRVLAFVDTVVGLPTVTPVTVATAGTNTQFRGPAFPPSP